MTGILPTAAVCVLCAVSYAKVSGVPSGSIRATYLDGMYKGQVHLSACICLISPRQKSGDPVDSQLQNLWFSIRFNSAAFQFSK